MKFSSLTVLKKRAVPALRYSKEGFFPVNAFPYGYFLTLPLLGGVPAFLLGQIRGFSGVAATLSALLFGDSY